ncbi:AAA family ATPase [Paracoccus sphaerophysae]|uniref:AAA family ATPase n=1 Tax=Paracoccus sphaerophysae TaxID=690417 RepID=UPI002354843C|nr:AAA family ATPase [Paracoccus sphaerophysae]
MTHTISPDCTAHNLTTTQARSAAPVPSAVVNTNPAPAAPPLWAGEPCDPHRARWGEVPAGDNGANLQDDDLALLPPCNPEPTDRPGRLLLMARLLATLGARVDDGSWLAPMAVTVLSVPPGLAERVEHALKRLIPHAGPSHGACTILRIGDTALGKGAQARFSGSVRKALDQAEPLIVLISSPADLEPSLRAALPAPFPFAPVTPEIVREVLASVFPEYVAAGVEEPEGGGRASDASRGVSESGSETAGNLKEVAETAATRACSDDVVSAGSDAEASVGLCPDLRLPDAAALAHLSDDDVLVALRAGTAAEAAAALRARVRLRAATAAPTLDDIAGYGEAEAAARRLVADLGRWARGEVPWRDMTRSLLLEGEPGTGKTFLARAIGSSAGVPFHASSLAEWQAAGHLGDTLRAMQTVFAAARAQVPAILFIDEIDSLGTRGGRDTHGSSYRAQVINAFLAEVDGVRDMEGVVLIGATNDAAALDPAIIRPGRFDRTVRVPRPGPAAVRKILAHHLRDDIPADDLEHIVPLASGLSAAGIDAAIREARSRAREAARPFAVADLEAVLQPALAHSAERVWRIAVHEAGHVVVALRLTDAVPRRITATPRGGSVEFDWPAPPATRAEIEARLAVHLAGRAAEEVILGEPSAGAGGDDASDLARATDLALRLETQFALGASGLLYRTDPAAAVRTDPKLAVRVAAHLEAALARAKEVVRNETATVRRIATELIARRVIDGEEIRNLQGASHLPRGRARALIT